MKLRDSNLAAICAALLFVSIWSTPAAAQIRFEFGGDAEALAVAYLQSRGYTEIKIISNDFFKARAEACKDGVRYRFKVRIDGRIYDHARIGNCGAITVQQARQILVSAGFRRVDVNMQNNRFIGFGCKGFDRFRVTMSLAGDIAKTKRVGQCRDVLSPGDVASKLREQGFDRIDFTDNELPEYAATACFDRVKFSLVLNGKGEILRERRVGRCAPAIDPRDIAAVLESMGYTRIEVIDRQLPRYAAEACRDHQRLEVTLDRFGRVRKERPMGRCASPLSREELTDILNGRGFKRINVTRANNRGFTVEACLKRRNLRMKFNIYGDFIDEEDLGRCQSYRVSAILKQLKERGFTDTNVYVEGCRRGRRIQLEFDSLGDRVGRKRLGSC